MHVLVWNGGWTKSLLTAGLVVMAATALMISGCPMNSPEKCDCGLQAYNPDIDPEDFVDAIDNPYFPLVPGTTYLYESETEEGTEQVEVTVTDAKVEILGVECTVVRDTVTLEGEVVEDTYDWYAQDVDGNVWYFGEASMEFEDGMVRSTFGSWEAGVHCAKPGIVMKADPRVGQTYRQEYYACVAEDKATVIALGESYTVPYESYEDCLRTEEFTPLDPDAVEQKVYAPGVGFIFALADGERTEELVSITTK
ncbi:MAG: hypothetical protein IT365_09960 [Candidatus Hydrogenedentes bacterium]|nr:hypothetical protein [Candidatus Hydrogenedentota bacterium]